MSESAQRWLWITAELPGEMMTGRLVYSGNLIAELAAQGVDLTVVGHGDPSDADSGLLTWQTVDGELRGGWRSLLSPLPNLAFACAGDAMRSAVERLLSQSWDVIVIDHLQVAWVADLVAGTDATTVFVTHNHEASVRRAVARELPVWSPRRAVLAFDAWKAARLETRAIGLVDGVTAITDSDRKLFLDEVADLDTLVIAPGWSGRPLASPTPLDERSRAVCVLGSFDWHVKQENLRRFVLAADDVLSEAGIELRVAGSVPDGFQTEIEGVSSAISFVGWVDDPAIFLDDCRLGLIAEPLGGGFKLKSLDYVFHGVPIAALAGSAAGLPLVAGRSIVEADDARELASAIVEIIDNVAQLQQIADDARSLCQKIFTWNQQVSLLVTFVATLRD